MQESVITISYPTREILYENNMIIPTTAVNIRINHCNNYKTQ